MTDLDRDEQARDERAASPGGLWLVDLFDNKPSTPEQRAAVAEVLADVEARQR